MKPALPTAEGARKQSYSLPCLVAARAPLYRFAPLQDGWLGALDALEALLGAPEVSHDC
ncbi:MAG TPA: hypothetical protein VG758_06500 [Hyphomicrobiaceae bacterium]|nr:hypothetical protein [Hyphomicrobiaceae bacterium]